MKPFYLLPLMLLLLAACATAENRQPMSQDELSVTCEQAVIKPKPEMDFNEIEVQLYEQGYIIAEFMNVYSKDEAMEMAGVLKACLVLYPASPQDTIAIFCHQLSQRDLMPFMHSELENGTYVVAVRPGSLPAQHGLTKGDIVRTINNTPISGNMDLNPLFHYGQNNTMEIERNGQIMLLEIFIPNK